MTTTIDSTIRALQSLVPSDDDAENVERLYEIFSEFRTLAGREQAAPAILDLLERFPEAEFGSPGPLVHELEAIPGNELLLPESLHRQPTDLTVWMVNRILNSVVSNEQRSMWLTELRLVLEHPNAPESTCEAVRDFLEHQGTTA
ncbi:MAG: hypothetical protein V4582_16525 [Pseudomonadota bacterium]